MCIYYTQRTDLSYSSREHIFPAALGGIETLPSEFVSDQANNFLSKYELGFCRKSLIALDRGLWGPGKRGSKTRNSPNVFVAVNTNGEPILAYLTEGTPHPIPCVVFDGKGARFSLPPDAQISPQQLLEQLRKWPEKFSHLESHAIPEGCTILGYDPVCKKYYYASRTKNVSIDGSKAMLVKLRLPACLSLVHRSEQQTCHLRIEENHNTARVYAKVALNVLAKLKGSDFASHPNFDDFRHWILGEDNSVYDSMLNIDLETSNTLQRKLNFPSQAHWCLVFVTNGFLCAITCFYNIYSRGFILGEMPTSSPCFDPEGVICDWRNKHEYSFLEHLLKAIHSPPKTN